MIVVINSLGGFQEGFVCHGTCSSVAADSETFSFPSTDASTGGFYLRGSGEASGGRVGGRLLRDCSSSTQRCCSMRAH